MFRPGGSERECVKSYEDLKGRTEKHETVAKGMIRMGNGLGNNVTCQAAKRAGLAGRKGQFIVCSIAQNQGGWLTMKEKQILVPHKEDISRTERAA